MKHVVLSILGTRKDDPDENSSDEWSPSVAIVQNESMLHVDEYHLVYNTDFRDLAEKVQRRIESASVTTEVYLDEIALDDPWNFDEVSVKFFDYVRRSCFHRDNTEYYVHINTGTNVERICLFWLVYSNYIKARLIQFTTEQDDKTKHELKIIDLNISGNTALTRRINTMSLEGVTFLKDDIQTRNKTYNDTIDELERLVLKTSDPILITGPTGAGKTKLASKIYELKKKHNLVDGPFVSVNCSTLAPETARSELFGHIKGSFTDAKENRPGLIKTAENGILFLDEVGDLTRDVQTMLLKAIEEHVFYPLGSDTPVKCDFQLICGTNQDLSNPSRFRQDLLERINRWSYKIPGLADRREDIEPNLDYEIGLFRDNVNRGVVITEDARRLFLDYALADTTSWNGNFRELRNMVSRMGTLCRDGEIKPEDVAREINRIKALNRGSAYDDKQSSTDNQSDITTEDPYLKSLLGAGYLGRYDALELATLKYVLDVCRTCHSAAEAGRKLYNVTRDHRSVANDSDRIAKFLKAYKLKFSSLLHA